MIREQIYAALFTKLSTATEFITVSRRLKHWSDVPASEQPALFTAQKNENAETVPGLNTIWILRVDVYLYANTRGNGDLSPSQIINPLLDAIVTALAPSPVTNKQTLGGLCEHCWIEGDIETDEGVLGDQAVCIVPIMIKVSY